MFTRTLASLTIALALAGSSHASEFNTAETACALEAASPFEPGFETTGKAVEMIDPHRAIETCWAALGTGDNDYRLKAWMARAYYAAGAFEDAFYYANRAAAEGIPLGQYIAGILYSNGEAGPLQPEYGAQLLAKSGEAGFIPALQGLAISLLNGTGVAQDPALAVEFLQLAADSGFGPAATTLGKLYFDGIGVDQSDMESARLLRLAVHLGDASGAHELALYAESGIGGPVDKAKAAELHETAIALGNCASLTSLAMLYVRGEGVAQDLAKAGQLLERAADMGDEKAQQLLSLIVSSS